MSSIKFLNEKSNECGRGFSLPETFTLNCINRGFKVWKNKKHEIIASKKNGNDVTLRFEVTNGDDWDLGEPKVTVFENNAKTAEFKISEFEVHD